MRNSCNADIAVDEGRSIFGHATRIDMLVSLGTGRASTQAASSRASLITTTQSASALSLMTSSSSTSRSRPTSCPPIRPTACWQEPIRPPTRPALQHRERSTVSRVGRWGWRTLLKTLDPEDIHRKMQANLDKVHIAKDRYYRLNIITDTLPLLDDVGSMANLQSYVDASPDAEYQVPRVLLSMVSSSFFFELEEVPFFVRTTDVYARDYYQCNGSIRVRGDLGHVMNLLSSIQVGAPSFTQGTTQLAPEIASIYEWKTWQPRGLSVSFRVLRLDEETDISLRLSKDCATSISGFPQTMAWFIAQQKMEDPTFGLQLTRTSPSRKRRAAANVHIISTKRLKSELNC